MIQKKDRYTTWIYAVIILLALTVLGIFLLNTISTTNNKAGGELVKNKTALPGLQEDTDKDGVKNWEEVLRGTDPKNPDTDNDGTSDGEEIQAGRDPLVPGPDDDLKVSLLDTTNNLFAPDSIFGTFNFGSDPTDESSSSISNTKITKEASALRKYGNEAGRIISEAFEKSSKYAPAFNAFIKNPEGQGFSDELSSLSQIFESASGELSAIAVPHSPDNTLLDLHVALTEAFLRLSAATDKLAQESFLESAGGYNSSVIELVMAVDRVALLLNEAGVVFGQDESGYIFTLRY